MSIVYWIRFVHYLPARFSFIADINVTKHLLAYGRLILMSYGMLCEMIIYLKSFDVTVSMPYVCVADVIVIILLITMRYSCNSLDHSGHSALFGVPVNITAITWKTTSYWPLGAVGVIVNITMVTLHCCVSVKAYWSLYTTGVTVNTVIILRSSCDSQHPMDCYAPLV